MCAYSKEHMSLWKYLVALEKLCLNSPLLRLLSFFPSLLSTFCTRIYRCFDVIMIRLLGGLGVIVQCQPCPPRGGRSGRVERESE